MTLGPLGLNKNSTHPNPWRPPSLYDNHFYTYQTVRIYRGEETMPKVAPNFFTDEPFLELCKKVAWKSFIIGSGMAATDIVLINQIKDNKARLARYLFVMPPFVAMGLSYVGTRHFLNSAFTAKEGQDAAWTYPVAAVAPASIWGIFRNDVVRGARALLFMSLAAAAYKYNHDCGGLYFDEERFFPSKPVSQFDSKLGARSASWSLEGWKIPSYDAFPVEVDPKNEPSWLQHVPEKDRVGKPETWRG